MDQSWEEKVGSSGRRVAIGSIVERLSFGTKSHAGSLHPTVRRSGSEAMLFPWYEATMLAIEAGGVVALRFLKLAAGGWDALAEAELMTTEKVDALVEAAVNLCDGATLAELVGRCRERVAANALRLRTPQETR